jgi:hypothetical protein
LNLDFSSPIYIEFFLNFLDPRLIFSYISLGCDIMGDPSSSLPHACGDGEGAKTASAAVLFSYPQQLDLHAIEASDTIVRS